MTDYAQKYAAALDPDTLCRFPHRTPTEYANTALWGWVPTRDLPEHQLWLAAVMFRSHNGDWTLKAALALADDTSHLVWNPAAMSEPSVRGKAVMSYWEWAEKIRRTDEERNQVIRQALPSFGVDADTVDIGLAQDLFATTLPGDEYGRSDRIRRLLNRLRAPGAAQVDMPAGGGR
ncbi:hypothetical protein [Streptomyces niveus]|uniref:hypothetical protein n=1 Tax=Streptomyces niveus TaxID=193462 RepID=UPI00340E0C92